MEIIDKYKFILTLSNETELSVDEATELISKIPFEYLEVAINKYKNNGLASLKRFAEGSNQMVCEQCKECFNYLVSELGCYGNDEPCEYLQTDNQCLEGTLKSIKRSMH